MDYQKLDPALIAALDSATGDKDVSPVENQGRVEDLGLMDDLARSDAARARTFEVFIHTTHPLHADEADYLASLGVRGAAPRRRIFTATLPAPAIEALSEAEWVRTLRLSRALSLAPAVDPTPAPPSDPNL